MMTDKQTDPLIDKTVGGKYQILNFIGAGSFGSVYKAFHLTLKKNFALKTLHSEHLTDETIATRFQHEAIITSRLNHPNIVSATDHGLCRDTNIVFIVMEYVEGKPLKKLIKELGKLDVETALGIAIQLCKGIDHAHTKNVLHRDIKPSNILLTEYENNPYFVKISDFGIAKVLEESEELKRLTRTDAPPAGTYQYMAPEQFLENYKPNVRSDIYSIGCVLFEMLTGKPPYDASSIPVLMHMHSTAKIPPLELGLVQPTVEDWLNGIVVKSLSKEPFFRYQTVSDLLNDLIKVYAHLKDLRTGKTHFFNTIFNRVGLFLSKVVKRQLGNMVLTQMQKSKLRELMIAIFAVIIIGVIAIVIAINAFATTYLSDTDRQILRKEVEIRPLVLRQTKPGSMDVSAIMQLAFFSDEKLQSQVMRAQTFRNDGNLNAAIIEYTDALNSADRLGVRDKELGAQLLSEIAFCYLFMDNLLAAKGFSEESLSVLKKNGYENSIKALMPSLVRARALQLLHKDPIARQEFEHMQNTLRGADIKRRFDQIAYAQSFAADFFRQQNELDKAMSCYTSAEQFWSVFKRMELIIDLLYWTKLVCWNSRN